MTFLTLLTKEMRLRFRRERTVWIIIAYIFLMTCLGWLLLINSSNNNYYSGPVSYQLSQTGINLYFLLSLVQVLLIVFVTPSFTTTAINSEKESQTYDMLLCSRLSASALISGKLIAALMTALLLIAVSIPLFSLVYFFGGISINQILSTIAIFIASTFLVGSFGLLCSALFKRPTTSTVITYTASMLWLFLPSLITYVLSKAGKTNLFKLYPNHMQLLFIWNPLAALTSTFPGGNLHSIYSYIFGTTAGNPASSFTFGNWYLPSWTIYSLLSIAATLVFFVISLLIVKPIPLPRPDRKTQTRPVATV